MGRPPGHPRGTHGNSGRMVKFWHFFFLHGGRELFCFGNDFARSRGYTQGICSTFGQWYIAQDQSFFPGGGTLGISGWGCAARTLEPLAYTRASFSWILLPYTRVNSPNHSYPRVAEYGFSIFIPASWSGHWPESLVPC